MRFSLFFIFFYNYFHIMFVWSRSTVLVLLNRIKQIFFKSHIILQVRCIVLD